MYTQNYFNALHHPLLQFLHWGNGIQDKFQTEGPSSFKGEIKSHREVIFTYEYNGTGTLGVTLESPPFLIK